VAALREEGDERAGSGVNKETRPQEKSMTEIN